MEALETSEGPLETAEGRGACTATVDQGKRQVKPETAAFRASFTQAAAAHASTNLVGLSCTHIACMTAVCTQSECKASPSGSATLHSDCTIGMPEVLSKVCCPLQGVVRSHACADSKKAAALGMTSKWTLSAITVKESWVPNS